MPSLPFRIVGFFFILLSCASVRGQEAAAPHADRAGSGDDSSATDAVGLLFGGCGGVYFLAEPGELWVEVVKRERNLRGSHTELRAILFGPDREVLSDVTIPDDGKPRGSGLGPALHTRLSGTVQQRGVFGLNITISRDRYGEEATWGFRTNCPKYVIETARGHKDERHQEPIVLASPGRPGNVCFQPAADRFRIDVSGLSSDVRELGLFSADGSPVESLKIGADGTLSHVVPPDVPRGAGPWRLHLPSAGATVEIDGVTRWEQNDPHRDLCIWTPDPDSWFPFLDYRWLLTPYRRSVYGEPGSEGEIELRVHNDSGREQQVKLSLDFPGESWSVSLSRESVVPGPLQSVPVAVRYQVPSSGTTRRCHIRASVSGASPVFSTYSTLVVTGGEAPASRALETPIRLRPYQHENEQFGYRPEYPVDNQLYFDLENRPCVRTGNDLRVCRDEGWVETDIDSAVRRRVPDFEGDSFQSRSTKIAFDSDNDLYLLSSCGRRAVVLHSTDGGLTFAAYALPGKTGVLDIEQDTGHNVPVGPPPVVRYTLTARDPRRIWRRLNDLELFLPRKAGGTLQVGAPILLSTRCIGLSSHSGIPSSVVSREDRVHVTWGEATDPTEKVPGVPTYVVSCDRRTGEHEKPVLVGYGPPANDVHNSPSIAMDQRGYLHVIIGTHGRPFQYVRSREPNDSRAGWTEPRVIGTGLNQTYIGLVCGNDDTLHVVYRLWRHGEPFPHSTHGTLAYQRKRPGQPWEPPRLLVISPFSEYSIFYHRLTSDRKGRLFLSYDYWSTFWFYRNDHPGDRRAVLMSRDNGQTWKLAEDEELR